MQGGGNKKRDSAYRAVIFDLDGTLLDSLADIADSMNTALAESGYPVFPEKDYLHMVGEGSEALVKKALPPEHGNDAEVQRMLARYRRVYEVSWDNKTAPYPGIPELLAGLESRGLAMAVLSNKPDAYTRRMVAHFFPATPFAQVRGMREDAPRKPHPQGAVEIAGELGIAPGEFLYVGDTPIDMRTALGAGMYAVGVSWGFRSEKELLGSGARLVIHRAAELLDAL